MRIEWEDKDITVGRQVGWFDRSERMIVGWLATWHGDDKLVMISLSDGMVGEQHTKGGIAGFLNNASAVPVELLPVKR